MKKLFLLPLYLGFAGAQSAPFTVLLEQFLVSPAGEVSVLKPAAGVFPGNQIEHRVTIKNVSNHVQKSRYVRIPTPAGTEFVKAVTEAKVEYSLDGKAFSAKPMKTVKVMENGREVTKQVEAPVIEYVSTRYVVGALDAGKSAAYAVRFRVR